MSTTQAAGRVRAASAESRLLRAIRNFFSEVQALGPDVNERQWTREVDSLQSDLADSRTARGIAAGVDAAGRAWSTSAARTLADGTIDGYRRLTAIERVRAAGIWAVTAAFTVGIFAPLDPRPVSASRWGLWAVFLILGATAAVWAGPAVQAWQEWRVRRTVIRSRESA